MRITSAEQEEISRDHLAARGVGFHCYRDKNLLEIHVLSFLLRHSFLPTESDTNIFTSRFCYKLAREKPFRQSLGGSFVTFAFASR